MAGLHVASSSVSLGADVRPAEVPEDTGHVTPAIAVRPPVRKIRRVTPSTLGVRGAPSTRP